TIRWQAAERGLTGARASELLDEGEPRIAVAGGGRGRGDAAGDTGIALTTSMLGPGDERIVAERVHAVLSAQHTLPREPEPTPPVADLTGQWDVAITYTAGHGTHRLHLQQDGHRLHGMHQGDFVSRDIAGTIDGDVVTLTSRVTEETGNSLVYRFTGTVNGDALAGTLDMGEY